MLEYHFILQANQFLSNDDETHQATNPLDIPLGRVRLVGAHAVALAQEAHVLELKGVGAEARVAKVDEYGRGAARRRCRQRGRRQWQLLYRPRLVNDPTPVELAIAGLRGLELVEGLEDSSVWNGAEDVGGPYVCLTGVFELVSFT